MDRQIIDKILVEGTVVFETGVERFRGWALMGKLSTGWVAMSKRFHRRLPEISLGQLFVSAKSCTFM
jgi:hypothetical protein